jgi:hypothetical protein
MKAVGCFLMMVLGVSLYGADNLYKNTTGKWSNSFIVADDYNIIPYNKSNREQRYLIKKKIDGDLRNSFRIVRLVFDSEKSMIERMSFIEDSIVAEKNTSVVNKQYGTVKIYRLASKKGSSLYYSVLPLQNVMVIFSADLVEDTMNDEEIAAFDKIVVSYREETE